MGRCNHAPVVEVNHNHILNADNVSNAINDRNFTYKNEEFISIDEYLSKGGYKLYNKIVNGEVSFNEMTEIFSEAGLRGLGGAGFPALKNGSLLNLIRV